MNKYTNNHKVLNKMFIPIITGVFFIMACFVMSNVVEASSKKKSIEEFVAEYSPPHTKIKNHKKSSKENMAKRNEFSKTFVNPDSTLTTTISSEPLHYQVGNKWVDIDTTINEDKSETEFDYSSKDNIFQVKFSKRSGKQVKFFYENASVSYKALNSNNVAGKVSDNSITFENVWTDTDVSYAVTPSGLKMFMLLKSKNSPVKFEFLLEEKNVKSSMNEDGSIDFVDKKGETKFSMPPLWVKDVSSEDLHYDPLRVEIIPDKKGSILSIHLDDSNLIYPLLIDPSTIVKNFTQRYRGWNSFVDLDMGNIPSNRIINVLFDVYINDFKLGPSPGPVGTPWPSAPYGDFGFYIKDSENINLPVIEARFGIRRYYGIEVTGKKIRSLKPGIFNVKGVAVGDVKGDTYNGQDVTGMVSEVTATITYDKESEDTIPPDAPTNVTLIGSTSNSAKLSWQPSKDNLGAISHYKIYNNGIELGSTSTSVTSYEVKNLQSGTYNFTVKAVDPAGNLSPDSNKVTFTPDQTPPTAPGNFAASSVTSNSVILTWSSSSDNVGIKLYKIFRDGVEVGTTSSTTNSYTVSGLNDNQMYTFAIVAIDLSGNQSSVSTINIKTPGTYRYIYDENQRLLSIVNGSGKTIKSFEYDRNGNLIKTIAHP